MNEAVPKFLERRLGRLHAKLRLGIEAEHEAQVFGQGIKLFSHRKLDIIAFCHREFIEVGGTISARSQKCDSDSGQTQLHKIAYNTKGI